MFISVDFALNVFFEEYCYRGKAKHISVASVFLINRVNGCFVLPIISVFSVDQPRSSPASQREALLELMWSVWPDLPMYGSKAAQFVDLLGYFTIKTSQSSEQKVDKFTVTFLEAGRVLFHEIITFNSI